MTTEEFVGKSDGSYAQTRGNTYPQAFTSANVGLPIEMFKDAYGGALVADNGVTSNSEALREE